MCNGQESVDCKNFRPKLSLVISRFSTLEWFQVWKPRPLHDNELDFTHFIFNALENVSKILISPLTLDGSYAGLDSWMSNESNFTGEHFKIQPDRF